MARSVFAEPSWYRLAGLIGALACTLAGCGGSSALARPVAQRICEGARQAVAAQSHGAATTHISGRAVSDVVCVVRAGAARVRIESQASTDAWTAFNTETSHQSQVYGSGVHELNRTPFQVTVPHAVVAVWVPGQTELIATNTSPTKTEGAYVTITVTGRHVHLAAARTLALAAAGATFAARPATA